MASDGVCLINHLSVWWEEKEDRSFVNEKKFLDDSRLRKRRRQMGMEIMIVDKRETQEY